MAERDDIGPDSDSFRRFTERLCSQEFVSDLSRSTDLPVDAVRMRLTMAIAEARQTLRVIEGLDVAAGERVLEVGAGLGVASAYLSSRGFEVTALEPGGVGFAEHLVVGAKLVELAGWNHSLLTVLVEQLDPALHGQFSLVFSNNVVEHVERPGTCFRAMASVLTPDGLMVHSCPNYSIPYEPHFGLPLLPCRPRWTARLLPRPVGTSDLWRSLNFIRARDVIASARQLGYVVEFRSGALAASLERLGTDVEFRSRHRLLAGAAVLIRSTGAIRALRRLPSTWSTPMDFLMCPPTTDPSRIASWRERTERVSRGGAAEAASA
ncbi:MAG: uncharacterized protein JWN99_1268 [Ilumatobacteraceae bacterium]|nr:uncharacterized protein [Ilumatobacteraceae bacterium]